MEFIQGKRMGIGYQRERLHSTEPRGGWVDDGNTHNFGFHPSMQSLARNCGQWVWGLNSWLGRGWNAGVGSGAFWKISVAYMVSLLVSSKFFLLLLPCGGNLQMAIKGYIVR